MESITCKALFCFILPVASFCRYSSSVCADIGRYASQHGAAAASRHFTHKLGHPVSKTTVSSIKKAFVEETKKKRAADNDGDVRLLPLKKCGRPYLLGEDLDRKLQLYV